MGCGGISMSEIDRAALDRWITGNYGEDQYRGNCENCGNYFYSDEEELCDECRKKQQENDKNN